MKEYNGMIFMGKINVYADPEAWEMVFLSDADGAMELGRRKMFEQEKLAVKARMQKPAKRGKKALGKNPKDGLKVRQA